MTKEEVLDKVFELKSLAVKAQDYEMASKLRDIEIIFTKGKHSEAFVEPTLENLKIELNKIIDYFAKYKEYSKKNQCLRDLKLIYKLDEI